MMMNAETLYGLGMILVFTGILIIVVAVILLLISSVRASRKGRARAHGVVAGNKLNRSLKAEN